MLAKALGLLAGAAIVAAAGNAAAQTLFIRDAAVRVVVTPEARNTITATISGGSSRLQRPTVRAEGGNLAVDGGLRDRIRGCESFNFVIFGHHRGGDGDRGDPVRPNPRQRVRIEGIGSAPLTELPFLDVRVPLDARVEASGAVFGAVGRSRSVTLSNTGCGDWSVANTEGRLTVAQSGSGDVRAGSSAGVTSTIRGSGDLDVTEVSGPLSTDTNGSGDVAARRVNGPVSAHINGSGNLHIADGVAQGLEAEVHGSGDVRVASANGDLSLATYGSGDILIVDGRAGRVNAQVRGSGDIRFGGEAAAADADIAGSGDITLARVSGAVNRNVHGSGDLTVNGRRVAE